MRHGQFPHRQGQRDLRLADGQLRAPRHRAVRLLADLLCLLPSWSCPRVLELASVYWKQTLEQKDTQERLSANVSGAKVTPAPALVSHAIRRTDTKCPQASALARMSPISHQSNAHPACSSATRAVERLRPPLPSSPNSSVNALRALLCFPSRLFSWSMVDTVLAFRLVSTEPDQAHSPPASV
jgi:hypothetical protein